MADPEAQAVLELNSIFQRLGIPGEVLCNETEGKHVCAARPIASSEVLLSELPMVSWPMSLFCPPPPPPLAVLLSDARATYGFHPSPSSRTGVSPPLPPSPASSQLSEGSASSEKKEEKKEESTRKPNATLRPVSHPPVFVASPLTQDIAALPSTITSASPRARHPPRALQTCFFCLRRRQAQPPPPPPSSCSSLFLPPGSSSSFLPGSPSPSEGLSSSKMMFHEAAARPRDLPCERTEEDEQNKSVREETAIPNPTTTASTNGGKDGEETMREAETGEEEAAAVEEEPLLWLQCEDCNGYFCSDACRHSRAAAALHQLLCGPARVTLTTYSSSLSSPYSLSPPRGEEKRDADDTGNNGGNGPSRWYASSSGIQSGGGTGTEALQGGGEQEGITLEALARCAALLILRMGVIIGQSGLTPSAFLHQTAPASSELSLSSTTATTTTTTYHEDDDEDAVKRLQLQIFTAAATPFNRLLGAPMETVYNEVDVEQWKTAVREALWQTAPAYLHACAMAGVSGTPKPDEAGLDKTENDMENGSQAGKGVAPSQEEEDEAEQEMKWCYPLIEAVLSSETLETLLGQLVLNAHAINTVVFTDTLQEAEENEDEEQDEEEEEPEDATFVEEVKRKMIVTTNASKNKKNTTTIWKSADDMDAEEKEEAEDEEEVPLEEHHHEGKMEKKKKRKLKHKKKTEKDHENHQSLTSLPSASRLGNRHFQWVVKGAGLYSLLSAFNHSCEPNIYVTHPFETNEVQLVTVRDISVGEPLTISYIPVTPRSEEERKEEEAILAGKGVLEGKDKGFIKRRLQQELVTRREMLRQYFFECHCTRCQREEQIIALL